MPEAAAPAPSTGAPPDDISRYLAEYQVATAAKPPAPAAPASAPAAPGPSTGQATADELDRLLADWDAADARHTAGGQQLDLFQQQADPARQRIAALENFIAQQQHTEAVRRDQVDAEKLISEFAQGLSDVPGLPQDYAKHRLYSEGLTNQRFCWAFDHRDDQRLNETQRAWCRGFIKNTITRLTAEARATAIDPLATEDREAVVFAVRSAGGRVAAEPLPQFGNMSDKEFGKYTREHFGF
jgi:hypothetical protein